MNRLARSLSDVINILDPDIIVLGGGMSNIDYIYKNISDYIISISGMNKSEIVGEIQNYIS